MSFQAIMSIDGVELNIKECSFDFNIDIDINGRPTSNVMGGRIHIMLESTTAIDFFAWMVNMNEEKDGEITFLKRDMASSYKTVVFNRARCISYREHFQDTGDIPMTTEVVISSQGVEVGGTYLDNDWYRRQS